MPSAFSWSEEGPELVLRSGGQPLFRDTSEHWRQAVLRLVGWSDGDARRFVIAVIDAAGGARAWSGADLHRRVEALKAAGTAAFPEPAPSGSWTLSSLEGVRVLGRDVDVFWTRAISGAAELAVAGTRQPAHGVLVRRGADGAVALAAPPTYEEEYFEGGQAGYGYGNLEAQSGWRMEKARRQVRQLTGLLTFAGALPVGRRPRLLDVGSGYGYLRQAAAEQGWEHEGLELSRHAREVARRSFGLETFAGDLGALDAPPFNCITMMDLVEHVVDPVALLAQAAARLRPGGLVVVRTPNLLAVEREVFGHRYHSFKAEHLHSFSPESLCATLLRAGLEPVHCSTEAHLLVGFLGAEQDLLARALRGSDMLVAGRHRG